MRNTHIMARMTQARHVIGNDDDSSPIFVEGAKGFEEMTTPLGINSKYDDDIIRKSGKCTKHMETKGGTQSRSGDWSR